MSRPKHYVPTIARFLVCALYHEAQHQGMPMTQLTNQLLERALTGSPGWHKAQEAMNTAGQQSVAPPGR